MKTARNLAFVALCCLSPLVLNTTAKADSGCSPYWADGNGYSIICDTFPDEATCPPDWELESMCVDWCWTYNGNNWIADLWGCSIEGYYQMEWYCHCWDPY